MAKPACYKYNFLKYYNNSDNKNTYSQQKNNDNTNYSERRVAQSKMIYVFGYRHDHVQQSRSRSFDADQVFDLRRDNQYRDRRRKARVYWAGNEIYQETYDDTSENHTRISFLNQHTHRSVRSI